MEFDDWKELMEEGSGRGHSEDWREWTDTTVEERDTGNTPIVDEFDVWAWLKLSTVEIKELLTKPRVSTEDERLRTEVDTFVLDCSDRGVSLVQLAGVLGLNVDSSGHCRALTRAVDRAKFVRQRQ